MNKDTQDPAEEMTEGNEQNNGELQEPELAQSHDQKDEKAELEEALTQINDKYLRLVAEFENYKRRTTTERIELIKTASKDVILSLLPVLDDFERAMKNAEKSDDIEAIKEGVLLIQNKLNSILSAKGLKSIETLGQNFDVELHEAITKIKVEDEKLKGTVIDETEKGYTLHDKIIRYAKVIIGE